MFKRFLLSLVLLCVGLAVGASELIRYTTPAERERGCSWADRFESQALVEANGGAVSGSPTFSPDGVVLDGVNDYLSYNLLGSEFDSAEISIVCEFTPDFEADEAVFRYLMYQNSGSAYIVRSNIGALQYKLHGTFLGTASLVDYEQYWKKRERNTLVLSSTSGDSGLWLNGHKIDSSSAAWAPGTLTDLILGRLSGGNRFAGTIHRLQIYKTQLSDQEAIDICNNAVYTYQNDATAIYLLDTASHDPANNRTLDASGNGNHLTLGDGAGAGEPTKLTHRDGYSFDGVNDYLSDFPSLPDEFSVVYDDGSQVYEHGETIIGKLETPGGFDGELHYLAVLPRLTEMQRNDLAIRRRASTQYAQGQTILYTDQSSLNTLTIKFIVPAGNSLEIRWGDGESTDVVCNGVLNTYTHDYSATGQYAIRLIGDIDAIARLDCHSQAWVYGDIANLSGLTSLVTLSLYTTSVSGDISNLSGLTSLVTLYLYNTSVSYTSTSLPPWAGCNQQIYSCGLDASEVDAWIIDLADGVGANGTLNIGGTNGTRTAASDVAKAALITAGWAVTVNE